MLLNQAEEINKLLKDIRNNWNQKYAKKNNRKLFRIGKGAFQNADSIPFHIIFLMQPWKLMWEVTIKE